MAARGRAHYTSVREALHNILILSGCCSKLLRYWARILAGSDVCRWGCAYTVLQTVQQK